VQAVKCRPRVVPVWSRLTRRRISANVRGVESPTRRELLSSDDVSASRVDVDEELHLVELTIRRGDKQRRVLLTPKAAQQIATKLQEAAKEAQSEQTVLFRQRYDLG